MKHPRLMLDAADVRAAAAYGFHVLVVQITGLNSIWRRPKYVFGIDGLQALHLAMKCASAVLESTKIRLEFLGQAGDLGLPKFLPELPKRELARLEAIVEREATKYWRRADRAHHGEASRHRQRTTIKNK
jgi:hypothetical protein